jgi:hypothetical protein
MRARSRAPARGQAPFDRAVSTGARVQRADEPPRVAGAGPRGPRRPPRGAACRGARGCAVHRLERAATADPGGNVTVSSQAAFACVKKSSPAATAPLADGRVWRALSAARGPAGDTAGLGASPCGITAGAGGRPAPANPPQAAVPSTVARHTHLLPNERSRPGRVRMTIRRSTEWGDAGVRRTSSRRGGTARRSAGGTTTGTGRAPRRHRDRGGPGDHVRPAGRPGGRRRVSRPRQSA